MKTITKSNERLKMAAHEFAAAWLSTLKDGKLPPRVRDLYRDWKAGIREDVADARLHDSTVEDKVMYHAIWYIRSKITVEEYNLYIRLSMSAGKTHDKTVWPLLKGGAL